MFTYSILCCLIVVAPYATSILCFLSIVLSSAILYVHYILHCSVVVCCQKAAYGDMPFVMVTKLYSFVTKIHIIIINIKATVQYCGGLGLPSCFESDLYFICDNGIPCKQRDTQFRDTMDLFWWKSCLQNVCK